MNKLWEQQRVCLLHLSAAGAELIAGNQAVDLTEVEDAHVVANLLLHQLRIMTPPLINYESIGNCCDLENPQAFIAVAREAIGKMTPEQFSALKHLINLIVDVANLGEDGPNTATITNTVAPYLCRPENSEYLSIRHKNSIPSVQQFVGRLTELRTEVFAPGVSNLITKCIKTVVQRICGAPF